MVSPLQSVIAGVRQQGVPDMGSLMREQAVTNSNLKTADLQRQNMQQQMGQRQQQLTSEQSLGAARYLNHIGKQLLASGDEQWPAILEPQLPQLQQLGYTPEMLQGMTRDQVQAVVQQTEPLIEQRGSTAAIQDIEGKAKALVGAKNPDTGKPYTLQEARQAIILRNEGIVARAGITPEEIGAREREKLEAQVGRKATIAQEVKTAQEEAKANVEKKFKAEDNARTLNVFDVAINGLSEALGATDMTGPIAGRIPATTTPAQIAESSKAIMLPILKQIFRQAGEGSFSDSDQRALEALLPRRDQTREAQLATIEAIDKIVRAKLGADVSASPAQSGAAPQPSGQSAAPQIIEVDF